jgi:hypothetical protein
VTEAVRYCNPLQPVPLTSPGPAGLRSRAGPRVSDGVEEASVGVPVAVGDAFVPRSDRGPLVPPFCAVLLFVLPNGFLHAVSLPAYPARPNDLWDQL